MIIQREFATSFDSTTKIVSGLIVALAVGLPIAFWQIPFAAGMCLLLMGVTVAVGYGLSARGYVVEPREIRVLRLLGDVVIPLENVTRAEAARPEDMSGAIRVAGSGGLFGYYGLYRTSGLGLCRWFVTNRANAAVVSASGKTYVFSPDNVNGFVSAIRSSVPVREAESTQASFRSYITARSVWAAAAAVLAVAGLIVAVMSYSPGPPRYTVTGDSLTIHDRFYPVTLQRSQVDLGRARVIDLAVDRSWRPTARTNGFSNSHYHSGWYRVAGGDKVLLYRASGQKLVLLPRPIAVGTPPGEGVLLEVADPEAFLEQLRRQWP